MFPPNTDLGWQWRQTQQRLSEWLERQMNLPNPPRSQQRGGGWSLQWLAPYITWVLGIALVGLLLFIIVRGLLGWWQRRADRQFVGQALVVADEPVVSSQEWRARARTLQGQGDFTQAARSLYFAMLQNLHDRQLIPEKRSRTDQEYAAITQDIAPEGAIATLLQTHEQIEFGGNQLSAQDYERCQQAYGAAERAMTAAARRSGATP
jgi:Domain of unknown function (DUF4129)